MTCITCGADLEVSGATVCAACGEPVATDVGRHEDHATVGADQGAAGAAQDVGYEQGDGGVAQGAAYGTGTGGQAPPPGANTWDAPSMHPSGLSSEVRGWALSAHLGALLAAMLTAATFGFLGPLLVWLAKREDHPFIDHHAKEALNFQLTVLVALLASILLAVPAVIVGVLTLGLGLIALALAAVAAVVGWIVLPIVAAVKASNGEGFRYPLTIRFVS